MASRRCSFAAWMLLLMAGTTAGTAAAEQPAKPVVAVFSIENRGAPLSADELRALGDFLAAGLGEGGRFQIVPREELRARLVQQKAEQASKTCYDKSCQLEIGREFAANYAVSTSLSKVGDVCLVTSSMCDLAKGASARTATGKSKCTPEALLAAVEDIASKLRTGAKTAQPAAAATKAEPKAAPARPEAKAPPPRGVDGLEKKASRLSSLPRLYIWSAFLIGPASLLGGPVGGDAPDSSASVYGLELGADWRMKSWFLMGVSSRTLFGDGILLEEISARLGAILRLSTSWRMVMIGQAGVSVWERDVVEASGLDASAGDNVGGHAGATVSFRYMFLDWLGFGLDTSVIWESAAKVDAEGDFDDGVTFSFGFSAVIGL